MITETTVYFPEEKIAFSVKHRECEESVVHNTILIFLRNNHYYSNKMEFPANLIKRISHSVEFIDPIKAVNSKYNFTIDLKIKSVRIYNQNSSSMIYHGRLENIPLSFSLIKVNYYNKYLNKVVQFKYLGGSSYDTRTVKVEKVETKNSCYFIEGYDLANKFEDGYRRYDTSKIEGEIKVLN